MNKLRNSGPDILLLTGYHSTQAFGKTSGPHTSGLQSAVCVHIYLWLWRVCGLTAECSCSSPSPRRGSFPLSQSPGFQSPSSPFPGRRLPEMGSRYLSERNLHQSAFCKSGILWSKYQEGTVRQHHPNQPVLCLQY